MGNHTYHISLHLINSGCLAANRLLDVRKVAGKLDFSAIVAYTVNVKDVKSEVFDMNLFQQQLKEGKVGETLVYN